LNLLANKIETGGGGSAPLPPSISDYIPLRGSVINFPERTYLSTTENRASKVSKAYPTVQFYIVFSRYIEMDGRVMGSSVKTHRVSEYFQVGKKERGPASLTRPGARKKCLCLTS
jgi:RNase P/RNase MRP subunit p29